MFPPCNSFDPTQTTFPMKCILPTRLAKEWEASLILEMKTAEGCMNIFVFNFISFELGV